MAVTIRDVARELGLSITTVSRALDGYADVAEATRSRVRTAAERMGYAPSHMARQMRRNRADAIGYVISLAASAKSQPASRSFADPFVSEFISGLGDGAAAGGLDLLVSVATPGDEEQALFKRWVHGRRVDGMVINRLRKDDWRVAFLHAQRMPFVANGRIAGADFPYIEVDTRSGFKSLVLHLARLGHTRIAYIGGPAELRLQQDRLSGYRLGLREAGLAVQRSYVETGDLTRRSGYEAAKRLLALASPPTAIIGVNDITAMGVLRAAQELGIRVGADLAVAGFDGIAEAEHTQPPLTTLNQPVYEIARGLVDMLVGLIRDGAGAKNAPRPQTLLQPELIERDSTLLSARPGRKG